MLVNSYQTSGDRITDFGNFQCLFNSHSVSLLALVLSLTIQLVTKTACDIKAFSNFIRGWQRKAWDNYWMKNFMVCTLHPSLLIWLIREVWNSDFIYCMVMRKMASNCTVWWHKIFTWVVWEMGFMLLLITLQIVVMMVRYYNVMLNVVSCLDHIPYTRRFGKSELVIRWFVVNFCV